MGYAEKRGSATNPYYLARFSDGCGKWPTVKDELGFVVRYAKSRDAKKAANDAEADVRAKRYKSAPVAGETFGQYVRTWFGKQQLGKRTTGNYRTTIETQLLPMFEHVPLTDIDRDRVTGWEQQLAADGYKPETVRTYRGVLSVILSDAVEAGKIDANPAMKPRNRGKRTGKARHRQAEKPVVDPLSALLVAERAAIMAGRDDEFILVVTKAWTGARWGELVGLERRYVRKGTLHIEWQLEELDDGTWDRCPPKEDSRRTVDLPPFLVSLLNRQVRASQTDRVAVCGCYRPERDTDPHPGGVYVFTGRTTRRREGKTLVDYTAPHWRRSGFESMVFKPAAEGWYPRKAPLPRRPVPLTAEPWPGLPVRGRNYVERSETCWVPICNGLTPHLLRHSHKTWMVEDHVPESLSHDRLGHELGGVGARYTHITDVMRARLVEALTVRWESALDARLRLHPTSPVGVLNDLLVERKASQDDLQTMIVPQDSHRREVPALRSRPRLLA